MTIQTIVYIARVWCELDNDDSQIIGAYPSVEKAKTACINHREMVLSRNSMDRTNDGHYHYQITPIIMDNE